MRQGRASRVAERIWTGCPRNLPRKFAAVRPRTGLPCRSTTLATTVRVAHGSSCARKPSTLSHNMRISNVMVTLVTISYRPVNVLWSKHARWIPQAPRGSA